MVVLADTISMLSSLQHKTPIRHKVSTVLSSHLNVGHGKNGLSLMLDIFFLPDENTFVSFRKKKVLKAKIKCDVMSISSEDLF